MLAVTGWVVWENRASEKIMTAAILSVVTAAATIGSVQFFAAEKPISETFPAIFMFDIHDKMPVTLPSALRRHLHRFQEPSPAPAKLRTVHPEYFPDGDPARNGWRVYHFLLQKQILEFMSMLYNGGWQARPTHFGDIPGGGEAWGAADQTEASRVYRTEELEKLMGRNPFAAIHEYPPQISVPTGTKLTVAVPEGPRRAKGRIELQSHFFSVSIETEEWGWSRGIGLLGTLARLSSTEAFGLATATYTIRIDVKFSPLRTGHPTMPLYKAWARQLIDELRSQLDEEIVWRKTKENYLFLKGIQ